MREIKFEIVAKNPVGKILREAVTLDELIDGSWRESNSVVIIAKRQFTGLMDKNGKEIYEGDIVGEKDVWWEPVVFDQGCFCVDLEPIGYHFEQEGTYLEVLGNIYENPELTGAR